MPPTLEALRDRLEDLRLPGGTIEIAPQESRIADHALRATDGDRELAHPIWFVFASLRGMGITVDELCDLAGKAPEDTLLYGTAEIAQDVPLRVGGHYSTTAQVTGVGRKASRDGSILDSVIVTVRVLDGETACGNVTSAYLFKRGSAQ